MFGRKAASPTGVTTLMRCLIPLLAAVALMGADTYEAADERPMLGVEMSPVTLTDQERNNLSSDQGVSVRQVFPNTAASTAGVQPGDVITHINGSPVGSMTDLRNIVGSHEVGDDVQLTVRRNGQDVQLDSSFAPWPSHIPFDRIDADAERRFRDWQNRRLARQRDAVDGLGQELADLKKALGDDKRAAPFTEAPALRQATALLKLLPAWTLSYEYTTELVQPAPGQLPPAVPSTTAHDPWQAVLVTSSRYRML